MGILRATPLLTTPRSARCCPSHLYAVGARRIRRSQCGRHAKSSGRNARCSGRDARCSGRNAQSSGRAFRRYASPQVLDRVADYLEEQQPLVYRVVLSLLCRRTRRAWCTRAALANQRMLAVIQSAGLLKDARRPRSPGDMVTAEAFEDEGDAHLFLSWLLRDVGEEACMRAAEYCAVNDLRELAVWLHDTRLVGWRVRPRQQDATIRIVCMIARKGSARYLAWALRAYEVDPRTTPGYEAVQLVACAAAASLVKLQLVVLYRKFFHGSCYVGAAAAARGDVETLEWARLHAVPFGPQAITKAAEGGHRAAIEWLRMRSVDWAPSACAAAARHGHFELLKWMRSCDCPWDANCLRAALKGGHLDIFRWALKKGCPCVAWPVLRGAVESGRPEVVAYAERHLLGTGCTAETISLLAERALPFAVVTGDPDVFRWVVERQKPQLLPTACDLAATRGQVRMLQYALQRAPGLDLTVPLTIAANEGRSAVLEWACSLPALGSVAPEHLRRLHAWALMSASGGKRPRMETINL